MTEPNWNAILLALNTSKELIRQFYCMNLPDELRGGIWKIYDEHDINMRRLNDAIRELQNHELKRLQLEGKVCPPPRQ